MPPRKSNPHLVHSCRGAALVVSLMILTVMTLVGVTAMRTSSLEVLMAGNTQLRTRALGDAENALLGAEVAIQNMSESATPFDFSASDGYYEYDADHPENNIDPNQRDWPFRSEVVTHQDNAVTDYVVEYYPGCRPLNIAGESLSTGSELAGIACVHYFRATGRSVDQDNGTARLVQSIYATVDAP